MYMYIGSIYRYYNGIYMLQCVDIYTVSVHRYCIYIGSTDRYYIQITYKNTIQKDNL